MENIYVALQHIGYKKHPSIKNKLIIDENVKNVVEKIFDMYANGHGSVEIVNYLNTNHYLSPTGYRKTGIVQDENKHLTLLNNQGLQPRYLRPLLLTQ